MNHAYRFALAMLLPLTGFAQTPPSTSQSTPENAQTFRPSVVVEDEGPRYVAPNTLDRIGRIWAPVTIDGKGPYRLVLDTSGNSSAIIPSVVSSLGADPKSENVRLIGVTGTAVVPVVRVDNMEVGELSLGGAKLPVVADVFGGAEGVLGPKAFADKRIYIDFRNDEIRITRSNGRAAAQGFTRISMDTDQRKLITFDIRVGGVKTKAILSTGAQRTIGNAALREALLRRAREGQPETIIGVTLDVVHGQSIPVPPIAIGDLQFRNVHITFADTYIFDQWKMTREPAMLIGMDVIGSLDTLVIDYRLEQLHLRAMR
jgi:hypothetical protein